MVHVFVRNSEYFFVEQHLVCIRKGYLKEQQTTVLPKVLSFKATRMFFKENFQTFFVVDTNAFYVVKAVMVIS